MLSVIVPIHKHHSQLELIRDTVRTTTIPTELVIVVNNPKLENDIQARYAHERVVRCRCIGRGYAFLTGIQYAQGEVILLLHADTTLPRDWSTAILTALENQKCVGGGFSLSFDNSTLFLKLLVMLSNIRFSLTGVMFGDRAIFSRADILKKCLTSLNVPIFEDVQLSQCLRKRGTTVLLKTHVVTSAEAFHMRGMWNHLRRILKCQLWYALGGDLEKIYRYYYSVND
jgi:glycosyltransferase involved in cell wall biosynthesis